MKKLIAFIIVLAVVAGGIYYLSKSDSGEPGQSAEKTEQRTEAGNFDEQGNLVRNNPVMKADAWFLIYEKPGKPALNAELIFTPSSTCGDGSLNSTCDSSKLEVGRRVRILGDDLSNNTVKVIRLELQ